MDKNKDKICRVCKTSNNLVSLRDSSFICNKCMLREKLNKGNNFSPEINKITDTIYLGNFDGGREKEKLKSFGVTHILICGNNLIDWHPNDFIYHTLPLEDNLKQDISGYFREAYEFIEKAKVIYLHCTLGMSRSASILISYLMKINNSNYKSTFDFVKSKRRCICPNQNFEKQLIEYEKLLLNNNNNDNIKDTRKISSSNNINSYSTKETETNENKYIIPSILKYCSGPYIRENTKVPLDLQPAKKLQFFQSWFESYLTIFHNNDSSIIVFYFDETVDSPFQFLANVDINVFSKFFKDFEIDIDNTVIKNLNDLVNYRNSESVGQKSVEFGIFKKN